MTADRRLNKLKQNRQVSAADMTPQDRYRLALNYSLQCFKHRGFFVKTNDELMGEVRDLLNGQCELVEGRLVYHQDADLSKKVYCVDGWV